MDTIKPKEKLDKGSLFFKKTRVTTEASGCPSIESGAVLMASEVVTESESVTLPVCE